MGATKRLYEEIIGKYDSLEANFRFLEEEYFMKQVKDKNNINDKIL